MRKYIDQVVDVKEDGNYGYRNVLALLSNGKENHVLVCQHLIKKLKAHKELYATPYGKMNNSEKFIHHLFHVLVVHQLKQNEYVSLKCVIL